MTKAKSKRAPAFDAQLGFSFDAPAAPTSDGALAGMARRVSSAVARILREDPRHRAVIAGGLTALLDDEVTKATVDKWASEASDAHNISAYRFFALVAETGRYDVFNALLASIGARLVVGEEVLTVELGHIETEIQRLQERRQSLRKFAPPIGRRGGPRA